MAQDSKRKRYIRRLKRENTLQRRYLDIAIKQRNEARIVAAALNAELKKYDDDPFPADEVAENVEGNPGEADKPSQNNG